MIDFSKKTETQAFFNSIIAELKTVKIKKIFTFSSPCWSNHNGYRKYMDDFDLYILFENDQCLVIYYCFIDELNVECRYLSCLESWELPKIEIQDLFNNTLEIDDTQSNPTCKNKSIQLEYSSIEKITLRSVTEPYSKWLDDGITYVDPTKETFDEIKFEMSNGKSFTICADDTGADGWILVWSEDVEETTK